MALYNYGDWNSVFEYLQTRFSNVRFGGRNKEKEHLFVQEKIQTQ